MSNEVASPAEQIDELAKFIMAEIPGEPSKNEGAVDTAIRLLRAGKELREAIAELDRLEREADPSGPAIVARGAAWRRVQAALGRE